MRIIAGELRGRRLAAPPGRGTRPMLDRVREALFSTLGERVAGARVADLFAGSGSLGLEALSRGAARVRFVERDRRALAALLENVRGLGVAERVEVALGDALEARRRQPEGAVDGERWFDLVLLDPPYPLWREARGRGRVVEALERVLGEELAAGGMVVLHTHPRDVSAEELPGVVERRVYGNTALWYLRGDGDLGSGSGYKGSRPV